MKLGMSIRGPFSASDLLASVAGGSMASGNGGAVYLDIAFTVDRIRVINIILAITPVRICYWERSLLQILKCEAWGLCIAVLPCVYNRCTAGYRLEEKNLGSYILNRVLCVSPYPGTSVEANKDKETISRSIPIQVANRTQDSIQRRSGSGIRNSELQQPQEEKYSKEGRDAQEEPKIYVYK